MAVSGPTNSQWRDLHRAFQGFCRAEPWEWLSDSDVLAVQHPSGKEMGYCVVLGSAGFEYGLAVYIGDAGLAVYLALMTEEVSPESPEALTQANAASALIAGREDLTLVDRAIMRKLGIRYGTGSAWPLFRSVKPGYLPWYLDSYEAAFLTSALRNVLDVASRVAVGELDLYAGREPGALLTRVQENGLWQDRWVTFPLPSAPAPAPAYPDTEKIGKLVSSKPRSQSVWELGFFYVPSPVQGEEGARPYYPTAGLVVDSSSTLILALRALGEAPTARGFQDVLVGTLENAEYLPSTLLVDSARTARLVESVTDSLDIDLSTGVTPAFYDAKEALMRDMA